MLHATILNRKIQTTKHNGSLATVTQDKINIAKQHLLACVGRSRVTAVSPSLVLDGFANGHRYADTGVTWKEWLGEYSVPWVQGIMGTVSTDLTEHMPRIKRFLFTGGGAHLVSPVVKGLGNAHGLF